MKLTGFTWQQDEGVLRLAVEGVTNAQASALVTLALEAIQQDERTMPKPKPGNGVPDGPTTSLPVHPLPASDIARRSIPDSEFQVLAPAPKAEQATSPARGASTAANPAPATTASSTTSGEFDLTVFGRLTKLADIVKEIRRQGAGDYEGVKTRIGELMAAEACPTLDRIASLDERLQTCCAALAVPGAV